MNKKENLYGYIFLLPSLMGLTVFLLFPVLFSLILSFCEWDLISGINSIKFVGLNNFMQLMNDQWFTDSLRNNFIFTIVVVPLTLSAALALALALNSKVFFKEYIRLFYFMPYISNIVAVTVVWMAMFEFSNGPINNMLKSIGIANPPGWLTSPKWALWTIILLVIWHGIGYCMIIYIAALQNIPNELYEACEIDGGSSIAKFLYVTFPMLSPTNFFLFVTRIIVSFQVFTPIKIMTQGGPGSSTTVLVYQIYREAFSFYKMGYASSIAWILFVIIFIITLIQFRQQKSWEA